MAEVQALEHRGLSLSIPLPDESRPSFVDQKFYAMLTEQVKAGAVVEDAGTIDEHHEGLPKLEEADKDLVADGIWRIC